MRNKVRIGVSVYYDFFVFLDILIFVFHHFFMINK